MTGDSRHSGGCNGSAPHGNLRSGSACEVSIAVEVVIDAWSREHYLLVPAAVYDGNRYPVRAYSYPPIILEPTA